MDLKRYGDIVAIKTKEGITAFHGRNMEVADLSNEVFDHMNSITLSNPLPSADPSSSIKSSKVFAELERWSQENNPDVVSGKVSYGIRSLTLNVTQICNLKCTYCAAGGDGTYGDPINKINVEKTLPQLQFFIERAQPDTTFNLSFVGGEPLLYPEAIKLIYDYVVHEGAKKNLTCRFMLTTNGTLINDHVLELLQTMRINITVSLDGETKINDQLRPAKNGKSSTEMTLVGLKNLQTIRHSLESLGVSAVFSSELSQLVESYLFFQTLNVDWYEFNFSYNENSDEAQINYLQQMDQIADLAWKKGGEAELRKIKVFNLYFDLLDRQQQVENFCGAGKSFLMIDAKNQVTTCPWEVGNSQEVVARGADLDGLKDRLIEYQKPLVELNNCQNCWARYLCGGGCMYINKQRSGHKHKKDPLFCERTRHLILKALVYYKEARAS